MNKQVVYSVTDFVAICNQILDVSFGSIYITGELSNYKISKNRWIYFDLKDTYSTLRFFGSIYQVPTPLEDGMMLTIHGVPQLHPKFGFSVSVQSIQLSGRGTIKKAKELLEQQLQKEGLFDSSRKRTLLYPPKTVGIVSSSESAGYADFIKIVNERWSGLQLQLINVVVQGEKAPSQITEAINYFNQHHLETDVLVIIRGGGSIDDLQAFNHEIVVRAVAGSRIPTLVAIGHETDVSLSEKVADLRASTPSNAAQLLLPDKRAEIEKLQQSQLILDQSLDKNMYEYQNNLRRQTTEINNLVSKILETTENELRIISKSVELLNPITILRRGYAVVRQQGKIVRTVKKFNQEYETKLQFYDGQVKIS